LKKFITVIGAGHVGLVASACLADFGLNVICVDKDSQVIGKLSHGNLPFYEPGLQELVRKNLDADRLTFSTDVEGSIYQSQVLFVAVGTEATDGLITLDAVHAVAETIAKVMGDYKIIVIKSTVPVGTAAALADFIRGKQEHPIPFDIVSNPEFLREGSAIENFMRPDRVVIGTSSERALEVMRKIYRPLYLIESPIVSTTNETAELIKFAGNAFLALKISFINEMANLADAFGCDIHVVSRAVGLDKRIGSKFLHPGPGFGGSCLPKDTRTLLKLGEARGIALNVIRAVLQTNDQQPGSIVAKLKKHLGTITGRRIAILGLAYKPNTDDARQSPAIRVCELLLGSGVLLQVHDPRANENARLLLDSDRVMFCADSFAAARGADAIVVLTEWNEFRNLDLVKLKSELSGKILIDARNIFDPQTAVNLGFIYEGVGRTGAGRISGEAAQQPVEEVEQIR
jgi:UDPglucose 6-dehydrogenase